MRAATHYKTNLALVWSAGMYISKQTISDDYPLIAHSGYFNESI